MSTSRLNPLVVNMAMAAAIADVAANAKAESSFELRPDVVEALKTRRRGATQRLPWRRAKAKVGRNEPCHCGSELKFKRCHGRSEERPIAKLARGVKARP